MNRSKWSIAEHPDYRNAYIMMEKDGKDVGNEVVSVVHFAREGLNLQSASEGEQMFMNKTQITQAVDDPDDPEGEQIGRTPRTPGLVGFVYAIFVTLLLASYMRKARMERLAKIKEGGNSEWRQLRKAEGRATAAEAKTAAAEAKTEAAEAHVAMLLGRLASTDGA